MQGGGGGKAYRRPMIFRAEKTNEPENEVTRWFGETRGGERVLRAGGV